MSSAGELEAAEHGDHGKAREWTIRALRAQRDPAWIADGYVSQEWLPVAPRSGRLDAFVWSAPPAIPAGPVLEQAAEKALAVVPPAKQELARPKAEAQPTPPIKSKRTAASARDAVAPLVAEPPLPDDPGPAEEAEEAEEFDAEEALPLSRLARRTRCLKRPPRALFCHPGSRA